MHVVKPVRLPKLLLAADLPRVLAVTRAIDASPSQVVEINAEDLIFAEPLPMCLLAAQLNALQRQGREAAIDRLRREVAERLERMNVLNDWIKSRTTVRSKEHNLASLQTCCITSLKEGNEVANTLAERIAQFVPPELRKGTDALTRDGVVVPLSYMLTELLENALTHGRGKGFNHASAWIAAQYYPEGSGDLIRLAIVDDGCGFLRSLESNAAVQPKTHSAAIKAAFLPGVSCNKSVSLFSDSLNAGIGLTISRDIAIRSGGTVWAGSGDSWIAHPGRKDESHIKVPLWQGTLLNFELHRAGLNGVSFRQLLDQYQQRQDAEHTTIPFI